MIGLGNAMTKPGPIVLLTTRRDAVDSSPSPRGQRATLFPALERASRTPWMAGDSHPQTKHHLISGFVGLSTIHMPYCCHYQVDLPKPLELETRSDNG